MAVKTDHLPRHSAARMLRAGFYFAWGCFRDFVRSFALARSWLQATMIRLRSSVREERPSCRKSRASERRALGA